MQNYESNQALGNEVPTSNILPNLEPIDINTTDTNILIAKRKRVRTCTQQPIERYVSYGKIVTKVQVLLAPVDSVEIPRNIQETLRRPEWTTAVTKEVQALIKKWHMGSHQYSKREDNIEM